MLDDPGESADVRQTNNALIASDTHGRLRIRLNRAARTQDRMSRIAEHFQHIHGTHVQTNAQTGSVMVRYDAGLHGRDAILKILADVGVVIREVAKGLGEDAPESGRSRASEHLITAFDRLDTSLFLATGYRVDLKAAFPVLLGSVGLWRLWKEGLGLTEVPAYLLLWQAFDAFFKLNVGPSASRKDLHSIASVSGR